MLTEVKGDLFATGIRCIAHGCNNEGVMGAGIAALVKRKFPLAFKEYEKFCDTQTEGLEDHFSDPEFAERYVRAGLLGQNCVVDCGDKIIFNMITQDFNGKGRAHRNVSYDAIAGCFEEANHNQLCRTYGLAIPLIGAGLGGGKWSVIKSIIEAYTPDINVTVYTM